MGSSSSHQLACSELVGNHALAMRDGCTALIAAAKLPMRFSCDAAPAQLMKRPAKVSKQGSEVSEMSTSDSLWMHSASDSAHSSFVFALRHTQLEGS